MQELENIIQEINYRINEYVDHDYVRGSGDVVKGLSIAKDIIRKHMSGKDTDVPTNDGWIPVDKNNVPQNEILACDRYGNELIGYLSYDSNAGDFVCESDECIMYQVTAWMEKPEPYRPERSEK